MGLETTIGVQGLGTTPSFPTFRAALRDAATTPVNIVVIGDSISYGTGASSLSLAWQGLMRSYYQTQYGDGGPGFIPCYWFGGEFDVNYTYGPTTGSWLGSTYRGPYGACRMGTGAGLSITVTLPACDAFDFCVERNPFTGSSWSWSCPDYAGGATQTVNQASSGTYQYLTVTGASGLSYATHAVTITPPTDGSNYLAFCGINCKRGTGGVRVHNIGQPGTIASQYVPFSSLDAEWAQYHLGTVHLWCLGHVSNDYSGQTALSTFQTRYGWILDQCVGGDVLCFTVNPRFPGTNTIPQHGTGSYDAAIASLAAAKTGARLLDIYTLAGRGATGATAVTNAQSGTDSVPWSGDNVHPNTGGHAAWWAAMQAMGLPT